MEQRSMLISSLISFDTRCTRGSFCDVGMRNLGLENNWLGCWRWDSRGLEADAVCTGGRPRRSEDACQLAGDCRLLMAVQNGNLEKNGKRIRSRGVGMSRSTPRLSRNTSRLVSIRSHASPVKLFAAASSPTRRCSQSGALRMTKAHRRHVSRRKLPTLAPD